MMDLEWEAAWLFDCPGHQRHGCTGTRIVVAGHKRDAEETVKEAVAQRVIGALELNAYVVVRRLQSLPH